MPAALSASQHLLGAAEHEGTQAEEMFMPSEVAIKVPPAVCGEPGEFCMAAQVPFGQRGEQTLLAQLL